MPEPTVAELAALAGREYIEQIKSRLRDDERWVVMLDPILVERTRWALTRIIDSIDAQKERVLAAGTETEGWLIRIGSLRSYAQSRLGRIAPVGVSTSKEARAWRAFSASLATALADIDPSALETLQAPYGGLSAAAWLQKRNEKGSAS